MLIGNNVNEFIRCAVDDNMHAVLFLHAISIEQM